MTELLNVTLDFVQEEFSFKTMSFELESQLTQFFECPVCLTYMQPPIFQCTSGHNICGQCNNRVMKCPLCRGPKAGRIVVLEKLSLNIRFPCQFASDGCTFTAKSCALKNHEIGCQFSCRTCPMSKLRQCSWTGMVKDLVEHYTQKHPQHTYFESALTLMAFGMRQRTSRRTVSILYVYDTVFLFCWEFNWFTNQFRFSVSYYGCPGQENRFSYTINILDRDTNRVGVRMSAPCSCTMEDDDMFIKNDLCVTFYFPMIGTFLNSEGNLRFILKIKDNTSTTL